jgi:hypothetical protein
MSFYRSIDDFLIDEVFQKVSDWWMDRTGKSNFWLAKMSFWGGLVTWSALAVSRTEQSWDTLALFLICGFWFLLKIREMEQHDMAARSGKLAAANAMRIDPIYLFLRCLILTVTVISLPLKIASSKYDLHFWLLALDQLVWLCLMYFPACTPRPPRPVRVQEPVAAEPSRA